MIAVIAQVEDSRLTFMAGVFKKLVIVYGLYMVVYDQVFYEEMQVVPINLVRGHCPASSQAAGLRL